MPGGNKNIKPSDGKQFEKGHKLSEKWTEEIALKFGNDLLEWMNTLDENIFYDEFIFMVAKPKDYHPTAEIYPGLIDYLDGKFSSFSKLIEKSKKLQEIKLKKFGCFDKLNPTMTKFVLINNHGWADNTKTELTGKDGADLLPAIEVKLRK